MPPQEFSPGLYYVPPTEEYNILSAFITGFEARQNQWAQQLMAAWLQSMDPGLAANAIAALEAERTKRMEARDATIRQTMQGRIEGQRTFQTLVSSHTDIATTVMGVQGDLALERERRNTELDKQGDISGTREQELFGKLQQDVVTARNALEAANRAPTPEQRDSLKQEARLNLVAALRQRQSDLEQTYNTQQGARVSRELARTAARIIQDPEDQASVNAIVGGFLPQVFEGERQQFGINAADPAAIAQQAFGLTQQFTGEDLLGQGGGSTSVSTGVRGPVGTLGGGGALPDVSGIPQQQDSDLDALQKQILDMQQQRSTQLREILVDVLRGTTRRPRSKPGRGRPAARGRAPAPELESQAEVPSPASPVGPQLGGSPPTEFLSALPEPGPGTRGGRSPDAAASALGLGSPRGAAPPGDARMPLEDRVRVMHNVAALEQARAAIEQGGETEETLRGQLQPARESAPTSRGNPSLGIPSVGLRDPSFPPPTARHLVPSKILSPKGLALAEQIQGIPATLRGLANPPGRPQPQVFADPEAEGQRRLQEFLTPDDVVRLLMPDQSQPATQQGGGVPGEVFQQVRGGFETDLEAERRRLLEQQRRASGFTP